MVLEKFGVKNIFKFVLIVSVDTVSTLVIIDMFISLFDSLNWKFKYMDQLIAALVPIITFLLFVNDIRVQYAYSADNDFT